MKKPKRGEENQNIEDWTDAANFDQKKWAWNYIVELDIKTFKKLMF